MIKFLLIYFIRKQENWQLRCKDCRDYYTKSKNKIRIKKKQEIDDKNKELHKTGFKICPSYWHELASIIPRDKVPSDLFIKSNGEDTDSCQYCRDYINKYRSNLMEKNEKEAELENKFYCRVCRCSVNQDEIAINEDNTISTFCKKCKIKEQKNREEIRNFQYKLRKEFIFEHQCSCQRCKRI